MRKCLLSILFVALLTTLSLSCAERAHDPSPKKGEVAGLVSVAVLARSERSIDVALEAAFVNAVASKLRKCGLDVTDKRDLADVLAVVQYDLRYDTLYAGEPHQHELATPSWRLYLWEAETGQLLFFLRSTVTPISVRDSGLDVNQLQKELTLSTRILDGLALNRLERSGPLTITHRQYEKDLSHDHDREWVRPGPQASRGGVFVDLGVERSDLRVNHVFLEPTLYETLNLGGWAIVSDRMAADVILTLDCSKDAGSGFYIGGEAAGSRPFSLAVRFRAFVRNGEEPPLLDDTFTISSPDSFQGNISYRTSQAWREAFVNGDFAPRLLAAMSSVAKEEP